VIRRTHRRTMLGGARAWREGGSDGRSDAGSAVAARRRRANRMNARGVVVTVAGEMSAALLDEFDDFEVIVGRGVTRVRAASADPSVLNGLIHRVESFGLELLEVRREHDP
jgi:hypothetical protein